MSGIAPERWIRLSDLSDGNSADQDRQQIRQHVADALGVSPASVAVELVGEQYRARIQGQDGDYQIDWTDSKDFERVKTGSASACLLDFGLETGPVQIPRLIAASEGMAHRDDLLAPRFRAALSRQLGASVRLIEVRVADDTLQARRQGGDWQPIRFAFAQENNRLLRMTTEATGPVPLADFGRTDDARSLVLPPLAGLSDAEACGEVRQQLARVLEAPPERILLSAADGQVMATVVAEGSAETAFSRLTEPFRPPRVVELRALEPADLQRLTGMIAASRSPRLSQLGAPPNPHVIRIPHYPPDLGRDQEIGRLRDDLARRLGTDARNIEIFLNDDGTVQAKKVDGDKVYDLRFTTTDDFARFSRYVRENPTRRLDSLGQRRYDFVAETTARTGIPDAAHRTGFTQSLQSRIYLDDAGNHQLRLGVELNEAPNFSPTQTFRLGYHHRTWGGGDLVIRHNAEGKYSISTGDIESPYLSDLGERFVERLKDKDGKAIAITAATLVGVAGAVWAASELLPETQQLDLPVDTEVLNTGGVKVNLGVRGELSIGGGHLAYDFEGLRTRVRENIASGVSASQDVEYNLENRQLRVQAGTTIHRFSASVDSGYDFAKRQFMHNRIALSQGFALSDRMNLSLGVNTGLNGNWQVTDASTTAGINYNLSDVWQFRAGASAGWNRAAVGAIPAEKMAYGLNIGIRAHF